VGRIVRIVSRVTLVTGGGALIVLNGIGAAGSGPFAPIAVPAALGSVVAGADVMNSGLPA
jgi:hypothetical protein